MATPTDQLQPNPAPYASAFVSHLLPEHVRKVEDEDERRKSLLCVIVLPAIVLFHLSNLTSSVISIPTPSPTPESSSFSSLPPLSSSSSSSLDGHFTFSEWLNLSSLVFHCCLFGFALLRRDPYATVLALSLWSNFMALSACLYYGFVVELFWLLACVLPLLFYVFGGRLGLCALVVVLLEAALFPHLEALLGVHTRAEELQMWRQPDRIGAALLTAFVVGIAAWLQDCSRSAYRDKMRAIVHQSEAANRELQQATAAKSNFLANMSHELRTPLHGITAMARELLETLSSRNPARECVEIIADSSEHMLGLVSDILDFERIENNRLDLESIPFSVVYEADKAITILSVAAKRKGITVDKDYRVALPMHVGDPLRFRQILFNLVSNAIKFTPEGGQVRVCILNDEEDEELIAVEVKDTGIGIAEEHKSHLFNCFSQVDSSIRRRYGGSGLGLAISKRLCEAMSGEIGYQSTFGRGSTFFFSVRLPFFAPPQGDYCEWAPFGASSTVPVAKKQQKKTRTPMTMMNRNKSLSSSILTLSSSPSSTSRVIPKSPSSSSLTSLISPPPSPGRTSPSSVAAAACFSMSSFSASLLTSLSSPFSSPSTSFSNIGSLTSSPSFSSFGSLSSSAIVAAAAAVASPRVMSPEGARILLVEDNEVNQKVAKRMIASLGCQVTLAGNGEVCLAILDEALEPFDVILMDCQMPILDGFHATLKIREKEKVTGTPRTPVVALTASATKEYQQKCFSVGMDDFLSKPFTKTMLARVLKRWIGTRGATHDE